ncbi:MAG: hypothetical protein ACYTGW_17905 [Planctomycetota bacterium]
MSTIRVLLPRLLGPCMILPTLLAAVLALAAVAPAQARDSVPDCTHQGIRPVPSKVTYGPIQKCGTAVVIRARGVTLRNPINACPLFAIYEPPHDKPTPKKDHFTRPGAVLPVLLFKMECSSDWLFFFIPLGTSCKVVETKNAASIQTYVEIACEQRDEHTTIDR